MFSEMKSTDGEQGDGRAGVSVSRRSAMTLVGGGLLGTLPSVATATSSVRTRSEQVIISPTSVTVNETGDPEHPTDDTDPETGLFDADEFDDDENRIPLLVPDGEQVTWGEYNAVDGSICVECRKEGTYASLHLNGLIPEGLYTIWVVVFAEPGFDGTFDNFIGAAPLGGMTGARIRSAHRRTGRVT